MVRRVTGVLILLLVVLGVAGFVVRKYLQSAPVKEKVVAQFKAVYKGDIKLGGIDVGFDNTSLSKLELFETGSGEKVPWLEIADLHTDLSILDYFQGNALPKNIKVAGAKLLLRFAADGTLLTTLPEPFSRTGWENSEESNRFTTIPVIEFENSQITLRTEGAGDLVFRHIAGKLDRSADQLTFTGQAANASWGKWTIEGLLHKQSARISLQFKSEAPIHVTESMLRRLPFLPPECWRELSISQLDTPILVHVDYDLRHGDVHCRAEFEPSRADFRLPSLRLHMTDASARIVLENNQVRLRDLHARTFAGTVRGGADVAFDDDGTVHIDGKVEANRLEVSQLPAGWGLGDMTGKLSGVASLKVVVTPPQVAAPNVSGMVALIGTPFGPVDLSAALFGTSFDSPIHTEGVGRGQIVDAVIGQAHVGTIGIELHAVPGGFLLGNSTQGHP